MTVAPFTPRGERARWRMIYDELVKVETEDVFTYQVMGQILDLDPDEDRHALQMVIRQTQPILLREHNRALKPVPNIGYRVVQPSAQLELAQGHQRKSGRSLKRGHDVARYTDFNGMPQEVRRGFEVVIGVLGLQIEFANRLSGRIDKVEAAYAEITGTSNRTQEEVAELKAQFEEQMAELRAGQAEINAKLDDKT